MRAAGRTADTRTPPRPRSGANRSVSWNLRSRPEPRRRARKATHPVMRGGRGGVVSPCGQPSRESTPPYAAINAAYAAINAASPATECAHDASVSHRSLIQVFAIPAAYARRGGPHRHPTRATRTRPTTTNGCSPPTRRRPGPASPSPRSRDGDPNAANCPTSRSADSSDTANPTSTDGSKTPMCTRWPSTRKNKRAESLKFRPFRSGRRDLNPRPAVSQAKERHCRSSFLAIIRGRLQQRAVRFQAQCRSYGITAQRHKPAVFCHLP